MCNIIVFPEDTPQDIIKTFQFALRCAWIGVHDMSFVPYVPYPGSSLYTELREKGEIPPPSDSYFIGLLRHSEIGSIRSHNPNFSQRQMSLMRLAFFAMFYIMGYLFRPYRIFQNIWNVITNRPQSRGERVLCGISQRLAKIASGSKRAESKNKKNKNNKSNGTDGVSPVRQA